jgi:transposase
MNKKNMRDSSIEILKEKGYLEADANSLFLLQMEAIMVFRLADIIPNHFILENIVCEDDITRYFLNSITNSAECPHCHVISTNEYKDYKRKVMQDLSSDKKAVMFDLKLKRFLCENSNCKHKIFVERLYSIVDEHGRKTKRFKEHCVDMALACGGLGAEREIRSEGSIVSNDTIIRYVKDKAARVVANNLTQDKVEVLGVDDFNLRKGDSSSACTVFVDGETGDVLIMVEGTDKETVQKVLIKFPSAKFMSRDRACSLSSAGEACGKTQVSDRFHLMQNIHKAIDEALASELPVNIFIRDGESWLKTNLNGDEPEKVYFYVSDDDVEKRIQLAGLTPYAAEKYRNTLKMLELSDKGIRTADIAKKLGIPHKAVTELRRNAASTIQNVQGKINQRIEEYPENSNGQGRPPADGVRKTLGAHPRPAKDSIVEPYRDTVIEMWNSGSSHHKIHPEIVQQGFTGTKSAVYQYIWKLEYEQPCPLTRILKRKKPSENGPWADSFNKQEAQALPKQFLEKVGRQTVYREVLKEASATRSEENKKKDKSDKNSEEKQESKRPAMAKYSPLDPEVLDLMYGHRDRKAEKEVDAAKKEENAKKKEEHHKMISEKYPVVEYLTIFLKEFYACMDSNDIEALEKFIVKYIESSIDSVKQFAHGLEIDIEAVRNCLKYPDISNGPTEGANSRTKYVHRRSGGRASVELLNAYRVLKSHTEVA